MCMYIYIYTYICALSKLGLDDQWLIQPMREYNLLTMAIGIVYIIIYVYTCLCVRNHPGIDKTRTVQTYSSFRVGCLDFRTPG